ncbi:PP2C-domain-containing protein [Artomyces pyxidatus]|uniref:PP2C-domain-containing protein n=1 Tax=Artomyces pyxidatus TaxID=48021 RepID=A0ACB8TD92_9AGAM|nr:PP2C-domain-containing protein [Artomyces pyxidatus]
MGSTLSSPATWKTTESGENSRYAYGATEMQGWRITMEDEHVAELQLEDSEQPNAFFAVFDGHSGKGSSEFARAHLHRRLVQEDTYKQQQYEQALKHAFLSTDKDMGTPGFDPKYVHDDSGCAAVSALITNDKIYVANAGDSRSVLSVAGVAKALSTDHKPTLESERKRIVAAGGYVKDHRVNGHLALSRGLGDFRHKANTELAPEDQIMTADPEIKVHDITDEDEFLVLACDGIWDCLSSQQVVNVVRRAVATGSALDKICEDLCDLCLAPDTRGGESIGCDNMSVVIVAMLNGKTQDEWYAMVRERVEQGHGYATPVEPPQLYSPERVRHIRAYIEEKMMKDEQRRREREKEAEAKADEASTDGATPDTQDDVKGKAAELSNGDQQQQPTEERKAGSSGEGKEEPIDTVDYNADTDQYKTSHASTQDGR